MENFFAPCPRGLEAVLAQELTGLGAAAVKAGAGGVEFSGPLALCYKANLESRIASRILWRVASAPYKNEEDIYKTTLALPWQSWFDVSHTIRVNLAALRCELKSLDFVTLRIKDAICDRFRSVCGQRPSVNTERPDVRIHAFLTKTGLTLYLDTTGEPLFKRGWRVATTEAPLRENLAAGILWLAGWVPPEPLLDPMCGGGTFLIEAALMALDRAPGLNRGFAFEKLKNFKPAAWQELRAAATQRVRAAAALEIYGSDLYGATLDAARANIEHAGLTGVITLKQANVLELSPPAAGGVLVANLPYGVRMGDQEDLGEFYPKLGDALKQRFAGWRAYLLTADTELPRRIRLSASKRTPLYNGALECRLLEYKIIAGSARRAPPSGNSGLS